MPSSTATRRSEMPRRGASSRSTCASTVESLPPEAPRVNPLFGTVFSQHRRSQDLLYIFTGSLGLRANRGRSAARADRHGQTSEEAPAAPDGPLKVMIPENLTMEQVVEKNPLVELGGQYWPPDCWTHHHTAVVVPYYGQARHLQHLLFHLHPFLQRQQLHYGIYVVNQVNSTAFNRGKLRNVGFWEAMQEEDWDCVFFHDVNLLPEDDRNLYICDIFPAHVAVAIDKFNYKLPYRGYLGGVFALRPIHYLRINGFPSTHWGWGREDDDIAARLKLSGMPLLRPHLLFGRYHMLEEGPDPSQEQSPPSPGLQALIRHKWRPNGTDLLDYRLLSKELQPLYTNLTVDISPSVPG